MERCVRELILERAAQPVRSDEPLMQDAANAAQANGLTVQQREAVQTAAQANGLTVQQREARCRTT